MERELHPAGAHNGAAEDELLGGALAEDPTTRESEAIPDEEDTPPQTPEPGGALPDPTGTTAAHRTYEPLGNDGMDTTGRRRNAGTQLRTNGLPTTRGQVIDLTITHPTQVRFTCPVCSLTYPAHSSLARHVGVAHKSIHLEITFKCALCDYTHASKRSTSLHFRHAHGVAIPPATINGSNEKACPFCPLTFPSSHSCSTHIREKHMTEACQQRAREAAQKEAQRGESTARMKWTQRETEAFKAALAKYGPSSNIRLAAEIGTRSAAQVNVHKCRFLKAYPNWLSENYHPAPPVNSAPTSRRSSESPRSPPTSPGVDSSLLPATSGTQAEGEVGTQQPMPTSTPATQEEGTPPPPSMPPSEGTVLRLQRADRALLLLRPNIIAQWEPDPLDNDIYHPVATADNAPNSNYASLSPHSPPLQTPEYRSPSEAQAPRTPGTGARPATTRATARSARGRRPVTAVSLPPSQRAVSPPGPQSEARIVSPSSLADLGVGVAKQSTSVDAATTPVSQPAMSSPHRAPRPFRTAISFEPLISKHGISVYISYKHRSCGMFFCSIYL